MINDKWGRTFFVNFSVSFSKNKKPTKVDFSSKMLYNRHKARFLNGVYTGGYALTFIFTGINAESMKGGVLMKSKQRTYGKKIALCSFGSYHSDVNIPHKSTIAALCYRSAIEK